MKPNNKGWFNESYRHSLASKGVHTISKAQPKTTKHLGRTEAPPKELYDIDWERVRGYEGDEIEINKEIEKVLKLFWWCSYYNSMNYFPFEKLFNSIEIFLQINSLERIIHHHIPENIHQGCYLSKDGEDIDEQIKRYRSIKNNYNRLVRGEATKNDKKELKDFLEHFKQRQFTDHIDVYDKIIKLKTDKVNMVMEEKINLFDKIIHLEHHRGNAWGMQNMNELRRRFKEEEYG